jgi:hypothetical protein
VLGWSTQQLTEQGFFGQQAKFLFGMRHDWSIEKR